MENNRKDINISLENSLAEDLENMVSTDVIGQPDISSVIEHLIKTNTQYILFKMNEKRKGKLSENKLKD